MDGDACAFLERPKKLFDVFLCRFQRQAREHDSLSFERDTLVPVLVTHEGTVPRPSLSATVFLDSGLKNDSFI